MVNRIMATAAIVVTSAGTLVGAPAYGGPHAPQACTYIVNYVGERTWPKYLPGHYRGDRDFKGHGPDVVTEAQLHHFTTSSGSSGLTLRIQMTARETTSDWTSVSGTIYHPFFTATAGYEIYSVVDSAGKQIYLLDRDIRYRDTDHSDDVFGPAFTSDYFTSFVRSYRIVGDTDGNEAGTRTGVTLSTRWMAIRSRKCA